ncbi:hypothetical protein VNO80_31662 [Phaseolus coccineus]|uniref:Uncharacterized protein n=1 Tax=Phaseolus coccineus TaxID=3886 RepID=A0AAN9L440_PHACN
MLWGPSDVRGLKPFPTKPLMSQALANPTSQSEEAYQWRSCCATFGIHLILLNRRTKFMLRTRPAMLAFSQILVCL